ncbi:MAG TPA: helix-turn-helix transcriptional regulator [Candidatus Hydrogenedentes bacterium]|nr:helix-turn-helix transcriptional regulator [Candidatus Hydrogenedentota bacterium]
MNVGRAIKILRETNGIRLGNLAKEAELSVAMLSMIESGQREASLGALRRLATSLSIPLDVLLAVAQPGEGTLTSSDERLRGFATALNQLEKIEQELREMTEKQVAT